MKISPIWACAFVIWLGSGAYAQAPNSDIEQRVGVEIGRLVISNIALTSRLELLQQQLAIITKERDDLKAKEKENAK
jgi:hypothetical protein